MLFIFGLKKETVLNLINTLIKPPHSTTGRLHSEIPSSSFSIKRFSTVTLLRQREESLVISK